MSDFQNETDENKDDNSNWTRLVEKIYSSSESNCDEIETLYKIIDCIEKSKNEILKIDPEYEVFYTCLTTYTACKLIENSEKFSNHQIRSFEKALDIVINYMIKSRSLLINESDEPVLNLSQFISIFESLMKSEILTQSIDLKIIIAILNSSKIPQFKLDNSNNEVLDNNKMKFLLSNYINLRKNENSSIESETIASAKDIPDDNPKSLLSKYGIKYMNKYHFSELIIKEFDTSLTYLNVYQKNHLKQFLNDEIDEKLMTNEEALQARANLPNLLNDFKSLEAFLNLPVQFTPNVDKITNFIQSAQIALLQTCLAEFILYDQNQTKLMQNQQVDCTNQTNYLVSYLFKIISRLNEIYLNICKTETSNLIQVQAIYINVLIEKQNEQLEKLKLSISFNQPSNELSETANSALKNIIFNQINLDLNSYLLNFISNLKSFNNFKFRKNNFFKILYNIFKNFFLKSTLLKMNNTFKIQTLNTTSTNQILTSGFNQIKNIDDPNTDEDNEDNEDACIQDEDDDTIATTVTTYTNITSANQVNSNEETDDYLLIGSWLYDQINSQINETNPIQTTVNERSDQNNNANLSNSTQILDTTFDLDSGNCKNSFLGFIDLMTDLLDLIKDLMKNSNEMCDHVKTYFNADLIKDVCLIEKEACNLSDSLFNSIHAFIRFLIINNTFNIENQDLILKYLNLNKIYSDDASPNVSISKHNLSILTQIYLIRLSNTEDEEETKSQITIIWSNFLKVFKIKIINNSEIDLNDLTLEHSAFLLFLFYNLSLNERKNILIQICQAIIDLDQSSTTEFKSTTSPLLISRLILLLSYILHNFNEPSNQLLNVIKNSLLEFSEVKLDFNQYQDSIEKFLKLFQNPSLIDNQNLCFYTFDGDLNQNSIIKQQVLEIIYDCIDYDKLYSSLVNLTTFGYDLVINESIKADYKMVSISYIFNIIKNLLKPSINKTDGLLKMPNNYLKNIINKFNTEDDLKIFEFDLFLSLISKLNNSFSDQLDKGIQNDLIKIFIDIKPVGSGDAYLFTIVPQKLFDFFTNFLTYRLKLDPNFFKSNVDILNMSLKFLKNFINESKLNLDLVKFQTLLIDLINWYKSNFKNEILKNISNENQEGHDIEILSLLLKSSKTIIKTNQFDSNTEMSYLINISNDDLFKDVCSYLNNFNQDLLNKENKIKSFEHLLTNLNWFSSELNQVRMMKNLIHFLIDINQNSLSSIDHVLIKLNGDINCLYFINEINLNELLSDNHSKLCQITFETIFECLTYYYLISEFEEKKYDTFFIELLKNVEKMLDNQVCMQGFIDYFLSKQESDQFNEIFNNKTNSTNKKELIDKSSKKFLILLLTSISKKSSKSYFIQLVSILNKLLKQQSLNPNNKQLSLLLIQLNHLSNLDQEFLQKWLFKLLDDSSTNDFLNEKFNLTQLVIFLSNDSSVINESVCLSILNTLIQLSNKLISNEQSVKNNQIFPDLVSLMDSLSSSGSGLGHLYLFKACIIWIEYYSSIPLNDSIPVQKSICYILSYIGQILTFLKPSTKSNQFIDTNEMQKYYQDILDINFNQKTSKLFDLVQRKESEKFNFNNLTNEQIDSIQKETFLNQEDDEINNNNNNVDFGNVYDTNNIDDTCNDQDQDDNYDLDDDSEDDGEHDYDDDNEEDNDDDDDEDDDFGNHTNTNDNNQVANYEEDQEEIQQTQPVINTQQSITSHQSQNSNSNTNQIDINELFGAYGVTYQIFDETENVLRNENRLDDEMDEDDDPEEDLDEDDDEEYGDDDFTDNFINYEQIQSDPAVRSSNPVSNTGSSASNNRDAIYQDLISTISAAAAAINGRIQNQINPTSSSVSTEQVSRTAQASETQRNLNQKKSNNNDDDDLDSKLCTYTITKKDFMNQHWYYCHTCKMIERIGMCTICAKVCHKDHDVSYAKYGSFFCDCGAKEDGSCKALTKRNYQSEKKNSISSAPNKNPLNMIKKRNKLNSNSSQINLTQTNAKKYSSDTIELLKKIMSQIDQNKPKQIEKIRTQILECIRGKNLITLVRDLLELSLIPKAKQVYENSLMKSNSSLAREELEKLRKNTSSLIIEPEQLFQVTLGSQEGAFENVRLTYTGDNGQLIKQLIQNHSLRRNSMCLVSSKKRKNLIVTHEKGKSSHLTILQLNALLKQHSNKRNKLTLTKLNTVPVPFTLISVVSNLSNEDYVCLLGLKDCYVMYLNENGQTKSDNTTTQTIQSNQTTQAQTQSGQPIDSTARSAQNQSNSSGLIILHPSLEASNYIIKSVWLPGSKTELALITSEFIKIYDLSLDKISPVYYFVLPMGKIKDVTFYYDKINVENNNDLIQDSLSNNIVNFKNLIYIVIITSDGYLYYEELNETSAAKNGVYYVTNTIEKSNQNEILNNQQFGSGVSVYYSFKLKLLFWSHQQGKTFIGSLTKTNNSQLSLENIIQLNFSNQKQSSVNTQPLCNWSEITSHPGLIMAMTLISNNPIVFMFLPDKILYQEIKLVNSNGVVSKAKIQDMVAIRHPSSSNDEESTEADLNEANDIDSETGLKNNNKEKTTLILLCDDGSLKIYVADSEKTEYWLKPYLRPTNPINQLKSSFQWSTACLYQLSPLIIKEITLQKENERKEKQQKLDLLKTSSTISRPKRSNAIKTKPINKKSTILSSYSNQFPIDYFEKCAQLNDIEYSGSDLLEIYNSQQLKSRLSYSNSSKFVLSKNPQGFRLEIINTNESSRMLLMGCRIMCGNHSLEKSPLYFEIFNRKIPVNLSRARWFDLCLTREEAFIADNKLTIHVGPSSDTVNNITIIDAVLCYGKSKTELRWSKSEATDLQKKYLEKTNNKIGLKDDKNNQTNDSKKIDNKKATSSTSSLSLIKIYNQFESKEFDRILSQSLNIYENCLIILNEIEPKSYKMSLDLISLISPPIVLYKSKSLLYQSLKTITLYNSHRDDSVLNLISETFKTDSVLDSEILEKCLLICKSIINEKRELNLVKYLNDKFCADSKSFLICLNTLFWSLINKTISYKDTFWNLCQIGEHDFLNLNLIIETLIEIHHSFLLVELNNNGPQFFNSFTLNLVVDSYMRLLLSDSLDINLTSRKFILQFLKPIPKSKPSTTNTLPIVKPNETKQESVDQEEDIETLNSIYITETQNGDEMLQAAMAMNINDQGALSSITPPAIQPRNLAKKIKKTEESHLNSNLNLFKLRKALLEKLCLKIPNLLTINQNLNGLKSIPFFQCILTLMSDLSSKEESDKRLLENLIQGILSLLGDFDQNLSIHVKSTQNEIRLIALRTLSILLSKSKYQRSGTETCNFIIQTLVQNLLKFNLIEKCLNLLKLIYSDFWVKKQLIPIDKSDASDSGLIKISNEQKFYEELSPYFVKSDPLNKDSFIIPPPNLYVQQLDNQSSNQTSSNNPTNQSHIKLFDNYIELLTELIIRLPYQMKKLCLGSSNQLNPADSISQIGLQFDFSAWTHHLCEYLLLNQCGFLKRLIKKLLQILCGSKDKYRKFKDQHILSTSISQLVSICPLDRNPNPPSMLDMGFTISEALESLLLVSLPTDNLNKNFKLVKTNYLNLTKLIDSFKLILEVAASRAPNWQRFCVQNPSTIKYLIDLALLMGVDSNGSGSDSSNLNSSTTASLACTSVIVPTILQLLLSLFGANKNQSQSKPSQTTQSNKSGEISKPSSKTSQSSYASDENLGLVLVNSFFKHVNRETIIKFLRSFLLEAYQSSIRWSMHSLVYNLFKNSSFQNQDCLYEILFSLWNDALCIYGSKSAQYVDILGYIVVKSCGQVNESPRLKEFLHKLIIIFKEQNSVLDSHPNALIYETIRELSLDLDGYYLESDPCFICNNIETMSQNLKLNTIKIDSRFTTNQQIFKLSQTHSIQRILFKITDIRKTKMIQTLNVYFTNRTSQSIVDLKMNLKLWSKAKQIHIEPGQSEIKLEFPLPIICSNLMFEYSDFYDRESQSNSESALLQCPRCSASVPAHPGVCTTCGENVFQCHKCRAINYDERDPFFCNSCGFCKFAKFDITLVGKQYSSVDPIESEEDRKQTLQTISSLLDRADKIYTFVSQEVKPMLEALIIKLKEQNVLDKYTIAPTPPINPVLANNQQNIVSNPSGIIGIRMTPLTVVSNANQASQQLPLKVQSNKIVHSIYQKYSECKSRFDELAKIVMKLNLCRKELREYDKQFKSSINSDLISSRKNSVASIEQIYTNRSKCYGCASSSIENCLSLFRALLCSSNSKLTTYVRNELCRNDFLEDILNFNLKRNINLINSNSSVPPIASVQNPSTNSTATTTTTVASGTNASTTVVANNTTTALQPTINTQLQAQSLNQKLSDRDFINLVFLLLKDNLEGSERFQNIILTKLEQFLDQPNVFTNHSLIQNELIILSSLIQKSEDSCWEMRLRLVIHILLRSLNACCLKTSKPLIKNSPKIIEELTLPCLRMIAHLSKTSTSISLLSSYLNQQSQQQRRPSVNSYLGRYLEPTNIDNGNFSTNQLLSNLPDLKDIDSYQFLSTKSNDCYFESIPIKKQDSNEETKSISNEIRLKYFTAWRKYTLRQRKNETEITNTKKKFLNKSLANIYNYDLKTSWFKSCLFCSSNRAVRLLTANLIQNLFQFYSNSSDSENYRKFLLVDLLADNLFELTTNSDTHLEYLNLFKQILNDKDSKYRFVIKHSILIKLDLYLQREIKNLSDLERLCETTSYDSLTTNLSLNLTQGLSIKSLTDLLSIFLKEGNIRNKFKSRLIATVLNSYLSLKKLLFQRTKMIDEAQEKLLSVLELLTSGTEQESRKFMLICIETVKNFDLDDLVTPVFIFERLCNIIYPEEVVDNKEFLMILEKDPNQEDYLQGRMLGNPYSSNEPGLGPLMRNIKNKICTDSELIALLEDDNGMELLVHNKIISLDLNVRDVYKKVWLSECLSEHEPMRIVYRMTGLLGDATEDIIDNLEPKNNDTVKNEEEIYRMAGELAQNGALPVMLERLGSINEQNFTFGKPLLRVLLKLFDYSLKLKVNRDVLIKPEIKTISTMLQTLNMMLKLEVEVSLAEKLISIMQVILAEASKEPEEIYNEFAALCGDREQLEFLLNNIKSKYVRSYSNLMQGLMGLIPFLSFGDVTKMKSLIEYFSTYISNFDDIDKNTSTNEDLLHLECFCVIVNEIEIGENGKRLRDMMNSSGILEKSIQYLLKHSPKITTYLNSDYDLWKDFINRNSLPYVLRILTGLCRSHEIIQDVIGESCIPLLHKLEQFSSGNLVGVLSEDLLVALKQNPSSKVAAAIEEVRTQTKNEKKKLAMAMRKKQLNQLGMRTNDKGQLLVDKDSLKNMDVEEEKGHICCICREGYKYHPQKVLAIYTFSKKVDLEPVYEAKTRKTVGYSTVTHFNLVHIDCHTNAIRSSRNCRDEWENAALQNANTKCNGILPIWGPEVTETVFSNALARHNNYLLEATGIRDVNYILYVHDLKLLLNRFAENLSFSEDSGGGGRESNINLIPYLIHAVLYSINTAKYVQREERNLANFLEQAEKLISTSFECDNVFYYLAMSLIIMKPNDWKLNRLKFLKRVLVTCHARLVNNPTTDKIKLNSFSVQEFKKYKSSLFFVGLVNLFFKNIYTKISFDQDKSVWTEVLATYIRHNDIQLMDHCKTILKEFEEEILVCEDWLEIFDVLGYLQEYEINEPVEFLKEYLQTINK